MPFLASPVRAGSSDHLAIDPATRESLEITQTMSGQRAGSLLATIDRTVTGAGARMLAADLSAPLMDRGRIEGRQALVQWLHDDGPLREDCARGCGRCPRSGARWGGSPSAGGARAIWGSCAMDLRAGGRCARNWTGAPTCPRCWPSCCRHSTGMALWSTG